LIAISRGLWFLVVAMLVVCLLAVCSIVLGFFDAVLGWFNRFFDRLFLGIW